MFDKLASSRELVFDFFATFSRFEYALKRAGFFRGTKTVKVDWDRYANTLVGRLNFSAEAVKEAVNYLEAKPPKTQVVRSKDIGWCETARGEDESRERYVLRLVSTVRNNLFHGGKYPYPIGPVEDVARNSELLDASLRVIMYCLSVDDGVRSYFDEAA